MMGPTHEIGAVVGAAGLAAACGLSAPEAAALAAGAYATAKLPDVDLRWHKGPDHRSWTHSALLGALLLFLCVGAREALLPGVQEGGGAASGAANGAESFASLPFGIGDHLIFLPGALALGLGVGYLSHLVLDALTPKGIPVILPGGPELHLGAIRTESGGETVFAGLLIVAGLAVLLEGWGPGLSWALGGIAGQASHPDYHEATGSAPFAVPFAAPFASLLSSGSGS